MAERFARVAVDVIAVVGVVLLAVRWRQRRHVTDDPLPAWLMAGGVAAVLAVVPPTTAVIGDHLPAADVVAPVLLIATVPLIVVGALIEVVRLAPSGWERASHRFLEWVLLAAGIVAIYTGLVAGLGRLVGGSGPTWFLVAAHGRDRAAGRAGPAAGAAAWSTTWSTAPATRPSPSCARSWAT